MSKVDPEDAVCIISGCSILSGDCASPYEAGRVTYEGENVVISVTVTEGYSDLICVSCVPGPVSLPMTVTQIQDCSLKSTVGVRNGEELMLTRYYSPGVSAALIGSSMDFIYDTTEG